MAGNVTDLYTAVKYGASHLMLSYYDKKYYSNKQMDRFRKLGLHLFMDSGAFSAWKKGIEINIDEYIKYIKENHIGKYINLDVVGDPDKTYYNLNYMKDNGLYPVPVFHMDSDYKYIERLIGDGYKYLCLGGSVGRSRNERIKFFNRCFEDYPNLYFHGLGMTDPKLITAYPWFSIDSTTWLNGRKFRKLSTLDGQKDSPKDMSVEERIGLNVKFFRGLEKTSIR
jgi:hypothetical protein